MKLETCNLKPSKDPFGELSTASRCPGLKQRFSDRILIMTTDRCFGYCAHCTRKWILGKSKIVETAAELKACVDYVKKHPKVRDVLLSGGDVLTLSDAQVMRFGFETGARVQIRITSICFKAANAFTKRITCASDKVSTSPPESRTSLTFGCLFT